MSLAFGADVSGATWPPQVEEITVTAQRRETTIERMPAAISVLGAEELTDRGIDNVRELQFALPSVTAGVSFGTLNVAIRGVGRDVGVPAVAINVDGVYQPFSATQVAAVTDLQRVEVLRGPQGTLYGRNANAGAINFVTHAPTAAFEGWLQGGYAEYDDYVMQGVLNVPLSDRVRVRASASYTDRNEGFVENIAGGQDVDLGDVLSGRLRMAIDVTDTFAIDLAFNGFRREGPYDYTSYNTPFSAAFIAVNFPQGVEVPLEPWTTGTDLDSDSKRTSNAVSATLSWRLPFATLRSITAHQNLNVEWRDDRDSTSTAIIFGHQMEHAETLMQELTLSGEAGIADWLVGAFYLADRGETSLRVVFPSGLVSLALPVNSFLERHAPRYDTDAQAVFGDVTFNLTDRLRAFAGLRYSNDELSIENYRRRGLLPDTTVVNLCLTTEVDPSFSKTTYRAGAQFDVAPSRNVYASVSTGFKDGGANIGGCNQEYDPEEIEAYEVGYKAQLFQDTVSIRTAAFYYDYQDFQVSQRAGIALAITNAAAASVRGIEAELDWRPDAHWTLSAALTVLDATYDEFVNTDGLNPTGGPQDLSGNSLNNAPEESAQLHVAYRTKPFALGTWTFGVDTAMRSRTYFREFNEKNDSQRGYAVFNAYVIWDSGNERYRVRAFGTNISDEHYYTTLGSSDVFGARGGTYGPPRQIGAELRVSF